VFVCVFFLPQQEVFKTFFHHSFRTQSEEFIGLLESVFSCFGLQYFRRSLACRHRKKWLIHLPCILWLRDTSFSFRRQWNENVFASL